MKCDNFNVELWSDINLMATKALEKSLYELGKEEVCVSFEETPHPLTFLSFAELAIDLCPKTISQFLTTLRFKRPSSIQIVPYSDEIFTKAEWDLLTRSFRAETVFPSKLIKPSEQVATRAKILLFEVLGHLRQASPNYWLFVNEMISTIIIAKSATPTMSFGGATQFFFWGGTVINSNLLSSKDLFLEQLLHESFHSGLFALCHLYGPLCTNLDDQSYHSAYRSDPRPMHGIIHAYFVAKNLAACLTDIINHNSFTTEKFKVLLEQAKKASESLHTEITEFAKLTPFGESILQVPEITHPDFLK